MNEQKTETLFTDGCAEAVPSCNYLTFTAEEDDASFTIVTKRRIIPDVQYSLDGGATWKTLKKNTPIVLKNKGDSAWLKGNNPEGFSKDIDKTFSFTVTGRIAASGSVMSLIDGKGETNVIPNDYCFAYLFCDCAGLTQAPELPATTLAMGCYYGMFIGCTSLISPPQLPATTLAERCYSYMFNECAGLTQAPKLPATTLAEFCYYHMFKKCTSLTQAPELPATKMAKECYYGMFYKCSSLKQAPQLPAPTLAVECYWGMFRECTGLVQFPMLPAVTLAMDCYKDMFEGCTGLNG